MKLNKEQKDVLKVMVKSLPKDLKFDSNAEKEICAVLYFKHLKKKNTSNMHKEAVEKTVNLSYYLCMKTTCQIVHTNQLIIRTLRQFCA